MDNSADSDIRLEKVATLQENLELIGNITSISFITPREFVVTTNNPVSIMIYGSDGSQIRKIGNRGKGAFEFESPALVRSHNGNIYVWCSMLLKLIAFDSNGNPINEYHFNKAIQSFEINDDYLVFYTTGGDENRKITEVYEIDSGIIVKEFGDKTRNQLLLELHQAAGAMSLVEDGFLFSFNYKPEICKVSFNDWSKKSYHLNDPEFKIIDINMTPEDLMKDIIGNAKHIYGSDLITGMYWIENNFVMVGETGQISMKGFEIQDFSNRKQRFYVFDRNMNFRYALSAKAELKFNSGFFTSDGKDLYGIYLQDRDNHIEYELTRIVFMPE